jgi:hypothetical protein
MLVACGPDAQEGDEPYFAAARPRLAEPETRSRVAGYLGAAVPAGVGWRTRLKSNARLTGVTTSAGVTRSHRRP